MTDTDLFFAIKKDGKYFKHADTGWNAPTDKYGLPRGSWTTKLMEAKLYHDPRQAVALMNKLNRNYHLLKLERDNIVKVVVTRDDQGSPEDEYPWRIK